MWGELEGVEVGKTCMKNEYIFNNKTYNIYVIIKYSECPPLIFLHHYFILSHPGH